MPFGKLEESAAWVKAQGEVIDVNDTLAGKLLGASLAMAMSLFMESHPALVVFLRLLFYIEVALFVPWLMRVVSDAAFLATIPFAIILPTYYYLTASLPILRALVTSFDVLYVIFVVTIGLVAVCDILRWEWSRSFYILGILLPFGVGLAVCVDAMAPEMERVAGARSTKVASIMGSVLFTSIPFIFYFDLVPGVEVNQYKLVDIGGREVFFSSFSVMASSLTTIGLFCLRWGFSAFMYPDSFIVLRGPMLKQSAFNNKAIASGCNTEDLESQAT